MKGIVLAGGSGTRLYPATLGVCKQLLPLYNKPMIYYPLSTLMLSGIRNILLISTPRDTPIFEKILGSGRHLGVKFTYAVQEQPRGLADAFIVGEQFIGADPVALILGDNIFFGHGLTDMVQDAFATVEREGGSVGFGYYVKDPERYGVIEFDKEKRVLSIEEKPAKPRSNWAQTGLYFYDNRVAAIAKNLKPSKRGELEITDVNLAYLREGRLRIKLLGRGFAWLDTGTPEAMLEASQFIGIIERRQNQKIAFLEEIAFRMGYITKAELLEHARANQKSEYGEYLMRVATEKEE
jgi:glucose-1-phosphate thymidylyltransferase